MDYISFVCDLIPALEAHSSAGNRKLTRKQQELSRVSFNYGTVSQNYDLRQCACQCVFPAVKVLMRVCMHCRKLCLHLCLCIHLSVILCFLCLSVVCVCADFILSVFVCKCVNNTL